MKLPEVPPSRLDDAEWARRKRANIKLGILFGVIVLVIFFASIWKYRPL